MRNAAFVLRQQMLLTTARDQESELPPEAEEAVRKLEDLVSDISPLVVHHEVLDDRLRSFDLGDLGEVAGITLYSGKKGYEETIDFILVPDLGAIAVRQDYGHKHHYVTRERSYRLRTIRSLYEREFNAGSPLRIDDDVEEQVFAALEELQSLIG